MKRFLPFLILIFLVNVIGFATYNLNKQQDFEKKNKIPNSDDNFSVHFEKERIVLPEFSFLLSTNNLFITI
jgi:preprotein translocase subunit SecG